MLCTYRLDCYIISISHSTPPIHSWSSWLVGSIRCILSVLPTISTIVNPGSGAPFHFHCHAFNALVYGRKKWGTCCTYVMMVIIIFVFVLTCRWFLHPPANKIYSKQHPLLWYMTNYAKLSDDKVRSDNRVITCTRSRLVHGPMHAG